MNSILYYITGHGYGHAVRSIQVIRALQNALPQLEVHVRTGAPKWLFADLPRPVCYTSCSIDVGVIQPDSLRMDLDATLHACRELRERMPLLLHQELDYIRAHRIGLVVGDIPPACFETAARAEIPSVAITNFTWDAIYRAYAEEYPAFEPVIEEISAFYRRATLALALPYDCGMGIFPVAEHIPWIARRSGLTRGQARAQFGLPQGAVVVLLSFGGIGLEAFPLERFSEMNEFYFVLTGRGESRGNVTVLRGVQRSYQDLVRAADVIVTKPGYGIVADALAHRVPVLYTDRGNFAEYPHLVHALNELATAEFISQGTLRSGDLRGSLDRLLGKPPQWIDVRLDGAQAAAEKILRLAMSH